MTAEVGGSTSAGGKGLIALFARHPVAANLLMICMLVSGLFSLDKLNRQFFPDFELDYITVRTLWPGASAEDVERSVTVPIEQALRHLDGVREMTSTSSRGLSTVLIEYEEATDMGLALNQVRQFVSNVSHLPTDAETPVVQKVTRHESVATLILSGDVEREALRPYAYRFERELLDRGISRVQFSGLPGQEIAIELDSRQIRQLGMSLPQLAERIASQSQDIAAGTVAESQAARALRGVQQKRSVEAFASLEVLTADGNKIALADIARIEQRIRDNQVEIFYQGRPAILMKLQRTRATDALLSARIMQDWLQQVRQQLPPTIHLRVFDERYSLIEQRINLLLKNGISGLVLVILILYVFLNGRVAFWVAVGIPTSFLGALAVLYWFGGTINMVSLFALIMALGIIVDDAIVVAEDSLAHYQAGEEAALAAEGGARRMLAPVVSSSLTTVAAFLPLMLISGTIGLILFDIPFVVICVIIASLIEGFFILPGHLRHSFVKHRRKTLSRVRRCLDRRFDAFREKRFRPWVVKALENRLTVLTIAFCSIVLAVSLVAFSQVKYQFFPQPESTVIFASVKFSAATPDAVVRDFALSMETQLEAAAHALSADEPLVVTSLVRLRTASFDGGRHFQQGGQYAMIQVELTEPDTRTVRNRTLIRAWRQRLAPPPGIEQLSISSPRGGPPGRDLDIFLSGKDATTLKAAAETLQRALRRFDGLDSIVDDLPYGRQQVLFRLTPLARAAGLSITEVGRQLRAAFDGQRIQVFYDDHDEIEVRLRLAEAERGTLAALEYLPVYDAGGKAFALREIIDKDARPGVEILRHSNGRLGVHVTAEVDTEITNANEVLDALDEQVIPDLIRHYGVRVDYKGRAQEERETSGDMKQGAVLALLMIYIILAWVFASYRWPLAVMIIIPFGLVGAIFGHWLLGYDLTILSQFGMFGLSGIVINDAIILVTFYKQLRARGVAVNQALVEASCLRLRAVLLTSLTTIAGLTPLLFETSLQARFLIPMATSISFGLAASTLLVLFLVPVLLSFIEAWRPGRVKSG